MDVHNRVAITRAEELIFIVDISLHVFCLKVRGSSGSSKRQESVL